MHVSNRHVLSTYYVSGTVLGPGNPAGNKIDMVPTLMV